MTLSSCLYCDKRLCDVNRSRGSVRNRADDHQDSWKTAKTVIKMNPSIEVPTSEQSSKPSVNAFTLDEGAMTSFNDMLNHLSVLCWDNQSQSLTIGDPARDLSETGIKSTLVFPSSTSTSARPEGLIELDTSSPPSMMRSLFMLPSMAKDMCYDRLLKRTQRSSIAWTVSNKRL